MVKGISFLILVKKVYFILMLEINMNDTDFIVHFLYGMSDQRVHLLTNAIIYYTYDCLYINWTNPFWKELNVSARESNFLTKEQSLILCFHWLSRKRFYDGEALRDECQGKMGKHSGVGGGIKCPFHDRYLRIEKKKTGGKSDVLAFFVVVFY